MDILAKLADSFGLIVVLVLIAVGYFRGRCNEREHLADLKRREAELRDVLLFATRYPPLGWGTLDPALVVGSTVLAADYFKMFVAGLRKMVGGRFNAFEILLDRARREAVLRMKEQARAAGCNMIFNVRIETTRIIKGARGDSNTVEVLAYGTAFARTSGTITESSFHHYPGPELPVAENSSKLTNALTTEVNLMRTPMSKRLLMGWFAAIAYVLLELALFQTYWYVDPVPWGWYLVLSGCGGITLSLILRRQSHSWDEAISHGLLWGFVLIGVMFFAALRINSVTDPSAYDSTRYRLERDLSLTPSVPNKPVLRFPEHSFYWTKQKVGSEHLFVIRCGVFGFCQIVRIPYANKIGRAHV